MATETAPTAAPATVQNAGSPSDAAGPSKDGATSNHDQKSFDIGYGKGLEKAKAAEAERDNLKAEIAKLKNAGKSAEELKADLDRVTAEHAAANKRLTDFQEKAKAANEARVKALPDDLRATFEAATGGDFERSMTLLPQFEALASKSAAPRPALPGGNLSNAPTAVDLTDFDSALHRGDAAGLAEFRKKHGAANVDAALKVRAARK